MTGFVVVGTDTDAGKTAFSLLFLTAFADAFAYWKPVETGDSDTEKVRRLVPAAVHNPLARFAEPVAPPLAALRAGHAMPGVADSQFTWNTLGNGRTRSTMNGVNVDHFMVKWDSVGRDRPGMLATAGDRVLKGTSLLSQRLAASSDAHVAVVATWNDLGEGTGIERNYDYYLAGAWAPPTAFMGLTRAAQCTD